MSQELLSNLRSRALLLKKARAFFESRSVLEVDCPILSQKASCDAHIDLIEARAVGKKVFLHSSPEYGMKRLLALGIGDIFQLSHVFRNEEVGERHNPEFLMCEWYRRGFSLKQMIDETAEFIYLFLDNFLEDTNYEMFAYDEAFIRFCDIEPEKANLKDLQNKLCSQGISYPEGASREDLLHLCYSLILEPALGSFSPLLVITDYPSTEAALAKTYQKGEKMVAKRFEFYYKGIELANGYEELCDHNEQKNRFLRENAKRLSLGKEELPIDDRFLKALEKGFPECCGVAVGIDRLLMLRHQTSHIADIIPFSWENA